MKKKQYYRFLIFIPVIAAMLLLPSCSEEEKETRPNFIIILCDDLGYADVGCFGHPTINTPSIDQLAAEGQRWTNFYTASSLCSPSRVGLLTGRLPVRCGMAGGKQRVVLPWSAGGMPGSEVTIAETLKEAGYSTACIGKWHVGHAEEEYLPNQQGFDYFLGLYMNIDHYGANGWNWHSYSTSKDSLFNPKFYDVPLVQNGKILEQPYNPELLTNRYLQESVGFIKKNKDNPFFLFLSHSMPHVPLVTSETFKDVSKRGLYGDVIAEIDAGVGEIIQVLKEEKLDRNTIVVFTSDNGPWLQWDEFGGTAGMLKGGKADLYDGGFRVPFIIWGDGMIKKGVVSDNGNMMDLFPSFCKMAGTKLPDRKLDGADVSGVFRFGDTAPEEVEYFYRFSTLYAIRKGPYKAYFREYTGNRKTNDPECIHDLEVPELYNMNHDPGEKYNIAEDNPDVIKNLKSLFGEHEKDVAPVENQLDKLNEKIWEERKILYQ